MTTFQPSRDESSPGPWPDQGKSEYHLHSVFLWLRKLGFARDVAWVGVAEAWFVAKQSLSAGHTIEHPLTWLHSTAYWAARNELAFLNGCECIEPSALDTMTRSEARVDESLCSLVREEVERLSPRQRQAIEYVFFAGMSYREAAVKMDVSVSTLRVHLGSAQGKLAAALSEKFPHLDMRPHTPRA